MRKILAGSLTALAASLLMAACTQTDLKSSATVSVAGVVQNGSDDRFTKVPDATVWLVPAADIAAMGKVPIEVKKDAKNDEPLEDSLAANRARYLNAKTNAKGEFAFDKVPGGNYFVYVEPAGSGLLPGGDKSRKALSTAELSAKPVTVKVSGNVPAGATYTGTSSCLKCHEDKEHFKQTMHRLGIQVVGKPSGLQDYSRFPEVNKGLNKLMAGTTFWFYGFDGTRKFDKYFIGTKAPADLASASFTATFFKDSDGKLKFRTNNLRDPADAPRVYTVDGAYGGGVYKQRYLYRVGANLFPFVQFNQLGDDSFADRGRKTWRDYHSDWLFSEKTNKLTNPSLEHSFEKECASCHYNGYSLTKNAAGAYIASSVTDPNGEMDVDGDGKLNEMNMGCETCHGPGSAHKDAKGLAKFATIVSPNKLAAERESMICVQCHSRPQGHLKNDQPVNAANKMMLPGTSRNEFLKEFTTREDAAPGDYWADGLHSKSHHQQGTDFIKSSKYRNGTQLVACSNCHNPHGDAKFAHQLTQDPKSVASCTTCHANKTDLKAHLAEKAKCTVDVSQITCNSCHGTKTMQTGAGMGKGLVAADGKNYWMNDITSHIYDVPRKDNKGVKGVAAGTAMPIPYTNACGAACHDVKKL
ncbi:cytochrome c3 family protein [Rhodoferax sp.]|uniref:cytochrome c3 family protein n=1 Tax=Rhodoferax sp. TaxID=50421 RepID=UPI00260B103A|nr:cytochrome c3 family protein [Rhodoferax sp.]MDD2918401.1 cytochrome c3 family protein [Rhodoferax sp.]